MRLSMICYDTHHLEAASSLTQMHPIFFAAVDAPLCLTRNALNAVRSMPLLSFQRCMREFILVVRRLCFRYVNAVVFYSL